MVHLMPSRKILKESLESFMKKGKCRRNNLETEASKHGLSPLTAENIVRSALEYYEEYKDKTDYQYKLLQSNCQHFATLVRFGSSFSDMSDNAKQNTVKISKIARIGDKLIFS